MCKKFKISGKKPPKITQGYAKFQKVPRKESGWYPERVVSKWGKDNVISLWWNDLVKRQFGDKGEVFVAGSRVFVSISTASGEAYLTTTIQPGIHQNTKEKFWKGKLWPWNWNVELLYLNILFISMLSGEAYLSTTNHPHQNKAKVLLV